MTSSWQSLFGDRPLVIDGGLSTQLEHRGHDTAGDLWTGRVLLQDPGAVTQAHADFVRAGAGVVISASYQVSRRGFVEAGLSAEDADDALRSSIVAARAAAEDGTVRVAASVGPFGAVLHDGSEYKGDYGLSRDELAAFHHERVATLANAAPDLLAVETIPDLTEAEALVEVISDYPDLPAWVSFTARDGERLWSGAAIEDGVRVAASAPNVIGVGINCTDPRHVTELVTRIHAAVELPVLVYPNAGGRWDTATGEWQGAAQEGAAFPESLVAQWRRAGAIAIGGCCGTDDRSIRLIADALGRTGS